MLLCHTTPGSRNLRAAGGLSYHCLQLHHAALRPPHHLNMLVSKFPGHAQAEYRQAGHASPIPVACSTHKGAKAQHGGILPFIRGVNTRAFMDVMRWSKTDTVQRYIHAPDEPQKRIASQLSGLPWKAPEDNDPFARLARWSIETQ